MKKKQITIIIIFIVTLIILLLDIIKTNDQRLDILLKNQGFISNKHSKYYKMQLSKSDIDKYYKESEKKKNTTFSTINYDAESFQILKTKMDYQDEVSSVYNGTYSYQTNEISYTTRFTFSSANVIVKGTYQISNKSFNCEVEFSYDVVTEKIKESLCNKSNFETLEFISDKDRLFNNEINNLINKILTQKNEE